MDLTITISWWIVPLLLTIFLFTWAWFPRKEWNGSGMLDGIPYIFTTFAAVTFSLISWLIWALVA